MLTPLVLAWINNPRYEGSLKKIIYVKTSITLKCQSIILMFVHT